MKIINHNAVNVLFERAEELGQEPHESWRCVYFKFADKPEKNNHALYSNFVVNPIISMLEGSSGHIYLCNDGDIFILFQGTLKPIVNKLSSHFGDIDPDHIREFDDTMFSVFDLGKQWDEFYELCETKYLKSLVIEQEARIHSSLHSRMAHHTYGIRRA